MPPAWRDQVKSPASFRGVPFFVASADLQTGRKSVIHEYPHRDVPFVEDLGRKARTFTVEGYVVGDQYLLARDALLQALETPGPGLLVHPYYGSRQVSVTGACTVRESVDEGGMARVSIEFTETEVSAFAPSAVTAPEARLQSSVKSSIYTNKLDFERTFKASALGRAGTVGRSLPAFSLASAAAVVQSYSLAVGRALKPVVKDTQALASFSRQINALYGDALSLVRTPVALATRISDLLRSVVTLPATPRLGLSALLDAYRFTPSAPAPMGDTPTRRVEAVNYDATLGLVRRGSIVQAAALAGLVQPTTSTTRGWDSYDDAIAVRDAITAAIDEQAAVSSDDVYDALVRVRTDVTDAVPGVALALPHLVTDVPAVTVPALVLTYRLSGSLDDLDDLLLRNRIVHPAFVLGGRPLQVLAHG